MKLAPALIPLQKIGKHTSFKFYGAFDFNKDTKIINADEYFYIGGVMSSIAK